MSGRVHFRRSGAERSYHGGRPRSLRAAMVAAGIFSAPLAHADPQIVLPQGLPVQVHPTFPEPGLPAFSFPTGGDTLLGGSVGGAGTGGVGAGVGGSVGGAVGTGGAGAAYDTMMAQQWGSQAADAAAAMGVSATALAATCMMESNCQNVGSTTSVSNASGAFQMISSTYTADINGAVAYNPDITGSVVSGLAGRMDPVTEAYAASYELRTDAQLLQSRGVTSDPTVLDVRAIYQFGAGAGPGVASAADSDNLESYINLTPAQLAANGLTASQTVGQWRQTVIAKLGSAAAYQPVLSGN